MQTRLHRSEWNRQRLGDLRQRQIVRVAQQQHLALRRRQRREQAAEVARGRDRRRRQDVGERIDVDLRPPPADAVERQVAHHRIEKGLHLGGEHEAGEAAEQVGERILEDVEGIVAIAGVPLGQRHDPVAIAPIERLERLDLAAIGARHEIEVAGIGHCALRRSADGGIHVCSRSCSAAMIAGMSARVSSTARIGSPRLATRSGTVVMVWRAGSSRAVTSLQASGVDTGAPGFGPHGERRRDGLAEAVLEEVDVDLAAAIAQRPGDGGDVGQGADHQPRQHLGEGRRLVVGERAAERDQDVQALLARGLDEVRRVERFQQRVDHARDRDHVAPRRALGVEVEDRPVGSLDAAARGRSTRAAGCSPC